MSHESSVSTAHANKIAKDVESRTYEAAAAMRHRCAHKPQPSFEELARIAMPYLQASAIEGNRSHIEAILLSKGIGDAIAIVDEIITVLSATYPAASSAEGRQGK